MDINDIQEKIVKFARMRAKEKGFDCSSETSFVHLVEELGEIARQMNNKK
jgi:NTP pyrophosphatase (non-canonical NTP hydrolase)